MKPFLGVLAVAVGLAGPAAADPPDPFREYAGTEPVPDGLKAAYAGFARAAQDGGRGIEAFLLPRAVEVTRGRRPAATQEYGRDLNLPFLRARFSAAVRGVYKEGDDCYPVRTDTSLVRFVQTKGGAWKVYRYGDKPID